jgi:thiol-disulfide isomerase/thioredoxin
MKKFLPAMLLFIIVFSAALAVQVGTSSIKDSSKEKSKNMKVEELYAQLDLTTINKKKIKPKDLKSKLVILNFWATWCTPCLKEMPSLVQMKSKFNSSEMTIISMNTDEDDQSKNLAKAVKKFNIENVFEVVADTNTKIADSFGISAIPVTLVFKNGKLLKQFDGPVDFASGEFTEKIKGWLKD